MLFEYFEKFFDASLLEVEWGKVNTFICANDDERVS
jgi:hypothetical protein